MNKIRFLIITLTAIIITSCYKGHNGLVEGTVTHKGNNLPVKNATINITESYGASYDFQIASGTTDENGHYKIYFNHKIYRVYHQFISIKLDSLNYKKEIEKNKSKVDFSL